MKANHAIIFGLFVLVAIITASYAFISRPLATVQAIGILVVVLLFLKPFSGHRIGAPHREHRRLQASCDDLYLDTCGARRGHPRGLSVRHFAC
jgi:hypothetical protein